jgi:hypothetical protein
MTPQKYQVKAKSFDCHPEHGYREAQVLGLIEELGEFAGKICKAHRKQQDPETRDLVLEAGDVIWRYCAILSHDNFRFISHYELIKSQKTSRTSMSYLLQECLVHAQLWTSHDRQVFDQSFGQILAKFCLNLDQILESNINKLEGRQLRETIVGEGDDR